MNKNNKLQIHNNTVDYLIFTRQNYKDGISVRMEDENSLCRKFRHTTANNKIYIVYINEVIRLRICMCLSLLLRLFCCFNKVNMRFFSIVFIRLKETRLFITLFIPHFVNKTTLVAHRCNPSSHTLLPYYQINNYLQIKKHDSQ